MCRRNWTSQSATRVSVGTGQIVTYASNAHGQQIGFTHVTGHESTKRTSRPELTTIAPHVRRPRRERCRISKSCSITLLFRCILAPVLMHFPSDSRESAFQTVRKTNFEATNPFETNRTQTCRLQAIKTLHGDTTGVPIALSPRQLALEVWTPHVRKEDSTVFQDWDPSC